MSLSEVKSDDDYRRDSFSDRVCDDLSEVILQYLSIEDKLRLECVSKHFQRTIFEKQMEIKFSTKELNVENKVLVNKKLNFNSFESLLKKCPNIESMDLCRDMPSFKRCPIRFYNKKIDLIIKYCHHLTQIRGIRFDLMSGQTIDKFVRKFGSKVTLIVDEIPKNLSILQSFKWLSFGLRPTLREFSEMNVKNVKKLMILFEAQEVNSCYALASLKRGLTHLSIQTLDPKNREFKILLNQISTFNELIALNIMTDFGINDKYFAKDLKQIGFNCRKLKAIKCCFDWNSNNFPQMDQFLAPLKAFKRLERLKLTIFWDNDVNGFLNSTDFSFKVFNGLQDITHLTLNFVRIPLEISSFGDIADILSLDETILEDIDINLPKLQYLEIINPLKTSEKYDILSRVSKLESINLYFTDNQKVDSWKTTIAEKCTKIKCIELSSF